MLNWRIFLLLCFFAIKHFDKSVDNSSAIWSGAEMTTSYRNVRWNYAEEK